MEEEDEVRAAAAGRRGGGAGLLEEEAVVAALRRSWVEASCRGASFGGGEPIPGVNLGCGRAEEGARRRLWRSGSHGGRRHRSWALEACAALGREGKRRGLPGTRRALAAEKNGEEKQGWGTRAKWMARRRPRWPIELRAARRGAGAWPPRGFGDVTGRASARPVGEGALAGRGRQPLLRCRTGEREGREKRE